MKISDFFWEGIGAVFLLTAIIFVVWIVRNSINYQSCIDNAEIKKLGHYYNWTKNECYFNVGGKYVKQYR